MSAITSATAPSGIFRSEIPAQCFNEVKSFVYDLFKEFVDDEQGWASMIDRIKEWGDEDVQEEIARLIEEYPDASDNYKYTFLKTIKAMDQRNGASSTQIKMSTLNEINYGDFFKQFIQRIVSSPDLDSIQKYRNLRPSDREIIARDAFRHTVYSETRNKYSAFRGAPRRAPPTVAGIDPDDSVSQAPSEIISIKPKEDERLSRSILELHNSVGGGGTSSKEEIPVPKEILKITSGSKVFKLVPSKTSRITTTNSRRASQATSNNDVIVCEIDSTMTGASKRSHHTKTKTNATRGSLPSRISNASVKDRTTNVSRASAHSRKSKIFTRSPRRVAKPQVPCFFEDDGIDTNAADVSTHVYR